MENTFLLKKMKVERKCKALFTLSFPEKGAKEETGFKLKVLKVIILGGWVILYIPFTLTSVYW